MPTDRRNQQALFNPRQFMTPIHVVGNGGIGSALVALLSCLGVPEIHVWDFDVVEGHNPANQLAYRPSDAGKPKVDAAAGYLERQESDSVLIRHHERVTAETVFDGIVMACVDSMKSRQAIWDAVMASLATVPLYADGRVGRFKWQLLTLLPSDYQLWPEYEAFLFSDDDASQQRCGETGLIHPMTMVASAMLGQLVNFARQGGDLRFNMGGDLETMSFYASSTTTGTTTQ